MYTAAVTSEPTPKNLKSGSLYFASVSKLAKPVSYAQSGQRYMAVPAPLERELCTIQSLYRVLCACLNVQNVPQNFGDQAGHNISACVLNRYRPIRPNRKVRPSIFDSFYAQKSYICI